MEVAEGHIFSMSGSSGMVMFVCITNALAYYTIAWEGRGKVDK
jgi:hypothetical protein